MKQIRIQTIALILTAALLSSCSEGGQTEESAASEDSQAKEVVEVMELEQKTVARTVEYPATLEAYEEVHLSPASPGRIENIFPEIGDRVSKGDLLLQMDRTQLHEAELQLENIKTDFLRLDTLAKYGSVAKQQYDQLKTQYEVAKSNVEFLAENTQLQAPFNGVISGRYFESGEMYSGSPNTPDGKAAVLSIVQIDRLKAIVPLSEKYYPLIKNGMETNIGIDIYPGDSISGRVFRIHPTIDPQNRTFNAEVRVNNQQGLLRPGMFARITFDLGNIEALLLPSMAVLKLQGSNDRYLFVDDNGTARRVSVTTGKRYDDLIEVFSDELNPGDRVIVSGQSRLVDGVPLDVKN